MGINSEKELGWEPKVDFQEGMRRYIEWYKESLSKKKEYLVYYQLESMACGTPVVARPVGGIPDIIKEGETGFIIEGNSQEGIAKNTIRALNHPDLEEIAQKDRALMERKFTYEKTMERYREVLSEFLNKS